MEKTYKRIPFNIEIAKKIQSGEIEGRIVTDKGAATRILCYDFKCGEYNIGVAVSVQDGERFCCITKNGLRSTGEHMNDGWFDKLLIELPEKISEYGPFDQIIPNPNHRSGVMGDYRFATKQDIEAGFITSEEAPKHEFKVGDKVCIHYPEDMLRDYLYLGCYQDKIVEVKKIVEGIETVLFVSNDELKEQPVNIKFVYPVETEKCEIETLEHKSYTFKPFDKVLVRESDEDYWHPDFFIMWHGQFAECVGIKGGYVIPYEGNEHLVGTTNKPKEE